MKKWMGPLFSVLLIVLLIFTFGPFNVVSRMTWEKGEGEGKQVLLTQGIAREGKKDESDPHFIQILKQIQEKIDGWLKSLNERIEKEDVTRFKVRFLEVLRNFLEWVKEKIDSTIESSERRERERKEKGGSIRETHRRYAPFFVIG